MLLLESIIMIVKKITKHLLNEKKLLINLMKGWKNKHTNKAEVTKLNIMV